MKNIKHTGAVLPSSKYLAHDVVLHLQNTISAEYEKPLRILEVGPGTGIFTEEISNLLRPIDRLDVVELNDHFYKVILDRFSDDRISVHHKDILKFQAGDSYDFIFSSIPFESLPSEIAQKIWHKKLEMSHNGTMITYYKYVNFNRFRCKFEKDLVSKFQVDEKVVIRNFPPARLLTLRITEPEFMIAKVV